MMKIETAVIDLDGTLVKCNSFTEFVKFMFRKMPCQRMVITWIVLLRKIRVIGHHEAKERIVSLAERYLSEDDMDAFAGFLVGKVNKKVYDMMRNAERKILATAAPELYVGKFAAKMNIPEYTATRRGHEENKGVAKLESVKKMGVTFGAGTLVITDHTDDQPLMDANAGGENYLVRN